MPNGYPDAKHGMDHVNGDAKNWYLANATLSRSQPDATATSSLSNYKNAQELDTAQATFAKDSTEAEGNGFKYGQSFGKALPLPSERIRDSLKLK